jgi:predicted nuclease with RNAse H fold
MSWTESEELNSWIQKSYLIGKREERKRIIELLKQMQVTALDAETKKGSQTAWVLENAIVLIEGQAK